MKGSVDTTEKLTVNEVQLAKDEAAESLARIEAVDLEDSVIDHWWWSCEDRLVNLPRKIGDELGDAVLGKSHGDLTLYLELYKDESKRPLLNSLVLLEDAYRMLLDCHERSKVVAKRLLADYSDYPSQFVDVEQFDVQSSESYKWYESDFWSLPRVLRNRIGSAVDGKKLCVLTAPEAEFAEIVKQGCRANELFDTIVWSSLQEEISYYEATHPEEYEEDDDLSSGKEDE